MSNQREERRQTPRVLPSFCSSDPLAAPVLPDPKTTADLRFDWLVLETYLQNKANQGISSATLGKYRTALTRLLQWMGEDEILSVPKLQQWRQSLVDHGYGKVTVQNYVKTVNDFLRTLGREELCIPKPVHYDLTGQTFGYLTVLGPAEKGKRRDRMWRCHCKCGQEVFVPATALRSGHTTSCGCLNRQILRHVNRYVEGTSLRQCLEDRRFSKTAVSGYVGVQPRQGKWMACITYKGVRYKLGTYSALEDAVRARARGKEWVMDEAQALCRQYADDFGEMPRRPAPPEKSPPAKPLPAGVPARRGDNTSGYTGVTRQNGKWNASICVKGFRYKLGAHETLESAVALRKKAQALAEAGDLEGLRAMCTNWKTPPRPEDPQVNDQSSGLLSERSQP